MLKMCEKRVLRVIFDQERGGKLDKEVFHNCCHLSGIVSVIKSRDRQDIMN